MALTDPRLEWCLRCGRTWQATYDGFSAGRKRRCDLRFGRDLDSEAPFVIPSAEVPVPWHSLKDVPVDPFHDTPQHTPDRTTRILRALHGIYKPEGVGVWLFNPHRRLDGEAVIDLLERGEYERIEQLIDQMESGAFV